MEKAHKNLLAVDVLLAEDLADDAASRLYYAGFHAAEAFLRDRELAFKTHAAVLSRFTHIVHVERCVELELVAAFREAFDLRALGDYSIIECVERSQVNRLRPQIKALVETVEGHLKQRERDRGDLGRDR